MVAVVRDKSGGECLPNRLGSPLTLGFNGKAKG